MLDFFDSLVYNGFSKLNIILQRTVSHISLNEGLFIFVQVKNEEFFRFLWRIKLKSTSPLIRPSKLKDEIKNAIVVDSREIFRDFITMNSKALIRLNDENVEVSLVYPEDADLDKMKLSVLYPVETAIIGYGEGSSVVWKVPQAHQ